ncbi:MAG: hypothetical protein O7A67_04590 [SAR324 cluster bacterium]|nr:hypothetical protein [SAR324 cluster bacterium]MCZ6553061.1 hypothetical protein [SAR324 cluster bacterium]
MLSYHNVVFVLEYLRTNDVSQRTQDRVLALLWKEARGQQRAAGEDPIGEVPEVLS